MSTIIKPAKAYAILEGIGSGQVQKVLQSLGAKIGKTGSDGVTEIDTPGGHSVTRVIAALQVIGVRNVGQTRRGALSQLTAS